MKKTSPPISTALSKIVTSKAIWIKRRLATTEANQTNCLHSIPEVKILFLKAIITRSVKIVRLSHRHQRLSPPYAQLVQQISTLVKYQILAKNSSKFHDSIYQMTKSKSSSIHLHPKPNHLSLINKAEKISKVPDEIEIVNYSN